MLNVQRLRIVSRIFSQNSPISGFQRLCSSSVGGWKINMLYDSECPLCMHEVNFLKKRDRRGLVKFTDIADINYDPHKNGGVNYEAGMKKIHAVTETGEVIAGMEVFREVYKAVGLGWVWRFTQLPGFSPLFDRFYDFWAAWRMKVTGRPELEHIFEERRKILQKHSQRSDSLCEDDCKIK